MKTACVLAATALLGLACHSTEALPEALAVMERHFAARSAQDHAAVIALHHPVFLAKHPADEWSATLAEMEERLGDPTGHELQRRKLVAGIKQAGLGSYVLLTYSVHYAHAETRESFILFKPARGGAVQIVDHELEATRFDPGGAP